MSEGSSVFGKFMAEVRRRHVGRVAIGYAAVAFVILQAAEIVLPAFEQPDWALRVVVVFTFLGFPVALALAWIYDLTPHGIERTQAEGREHEAEVSVIPRLAFLVITVLVATGSGWWFLRTTVPDEGVAAAGGSSAPVAGAQAAIGPAAYEPGTPITSLAVLPLDDFSEDAGQDYFVAGMHETLVAALSQLDGVRVVSRTTVNQYETTSKSMPQIAQELQVAGVVEGSVLRAGDQVRITVQLIHAPSDTHVWAQSYEERLDDIISLQGTVADAIAEQIQAELNVDAAADLPVMASVLPEARDLYMKGRFEQSKGTPEGLEAASRHFQEASQLDPSFAEAFAALSSTLLLLHDTEMGDQVDMIVVEEAASRALELNEDIPEAIAVITAMEPLEMGAGFPLDAEAETDAEGADAAPEAGRIPTPADIERMNAVRERIAVRFESEDVDGDRREAWVGALSRSGGEAIIPLIRKAMDMGKVPVPRQVEVANALVGAGHTEEAIDLLSEVVDESPQAAPAWSALERAHTAIGDYDEAVDVRMARMSVEGRPAEDLRSFEDAFERGGVDGYWDWCRQDMERKLANGERIGPADLATVYAALGMEDEAYDWLERAVEGRDPGLIALRSDPVWDPYRDQPEFREIARQIRGRSGTPRPPRGVPERRDQGNDR